ncbi:MAG: hypothetical protein IPG75_15300 [Gemmatimonadetes bacterium]|nr:hypothetical protein [Gemmatimonadota bacterium]
MSFLLAGSPLSGDKPVTPCEWAARLLQLESQPGSRNESLRLRAPFLLVSALYQHALFGHWPRISRRSLRADLKELKLDSGTTAEPTLLGLHYFLSGGKALSIPATLEPQLAGISESLDPALASPDDDVEVSSRTVIKFREIDVAFSHSVREGLQFIRKYRCLVPLEIDLLQRLATADDVLASPAVRRSRPAVADRVQGLVREFACRLVRRSLGVRTAITRDAAILREFQQVIDGEEQLLYDAVKQVGGLLNTKDGFEIVLNTTFGEPYPPIARRVVLTTSKQKVKPRESGGDGRPNTPMRFLTVGSGGSAQAIPLTYELFRSIRELQSGMLPAALPRTVNALLDTTRARLAGRLVRDEEALDGASITIGTRDESIVRELGRFLVRKGDEQ